MDQLRKKSIWLATAALGTYNLYNHKPNSVSQLHIPLFHQRQAACLATQEDWKRLSARDRHTETYVWGEGYQVDSSQEFSNFTPKKIRPFEGQKTPDVVDMAFGWYHEAYITKEGKLFVCPKSKISSIKISDLPDGNRELTEVKLPGRNQKVR